MNTTIRTRTLELCRRYRMKRSAWHRASLQDSKWRILNMGDACQYLKVWWTTASLGTIFGASIVTLGSRRTMPPQLATLTHLSHLDTDRITHCVVFVPQFSSSLTRRPIMTPNRSPNQRLCRLSSERGNYSMTESPDCTWPPRSPKTTPALERVTTFSPAHPFRLLHPVLRP